MREDVDEEEELLQRALAEQAAREVNYQRPLNKPPPNVSPAAAGPPRRVPPRTVKNIDPEETLVGPPMREPPLIEVNGPPRREAPRANGAPAAAPPRRTTVIKQVPIDDDDESDLELLSLSSDDEDEDQGRRPTELGNKLLKTQGAIVDEDVDLWDVNDEEPQLWSGVDQAEVIVDHLRLECSFVLFMIGSGSVKSLISPTQSLNRASSKRAWKRCVQHMISLPAAASQ